MKRKVVFFRNVSSVNDLLHKLDSLKTQESLDNIETVVMLDEFELNVKDIIINQQKIKESVKKNKVSLVMAPTYDDVEEKKITARKKDLPQYKHPLIGNILLKKDKEDPNFDENEITTIIVNNKMPWVQLFKKLSNNGIVPETVKNINDEGIESVGFFFSENGDAFAFPKNVKHQPIHRVPNTHIGITICGEVNKLEKPDFNGLEVVYNPSKEKDDWAMELRMLALTDPDITKQQTRVWLKENRYNGIIGNSTAEKEDFENEVEQLFKGIKKEPQENSFYLKKADDNVPVIRADGNCSGLLNPGEETSILQFGGNKENQLEITFESKMREKTQDFKKIYKALYAGETTFFKKSSYSDLDSISMNKIKKHAKKHPKSRSAFALKLLEKHNNISADNIDLIRDIHDYAYKDSGLFKKQNVTSNFKEKVAEIRNQKAQPRTRTEKIVHELEYNESRDLNVKI